MGPHSDKSFGEALRALMGERDLTFRSLLANGHDKPSTRAMSLIAQVCEVQPDYFAEYRPAAAMRELDPAEVGLEQALENLSARMGWRGSADAKARRARPRTARPRPSG